MSARLLLLPVAFVVLFVVTAPSSRAELPQAPAPRMAGEGRPLPPPVVPWTPRRTDKPWSELIVGKWLYTGRDIIGQKGMEFTRGRQVINRYSYPAACTRPKGLEVSTHEYRVNGDILFPTSTHDDGHNVIESTTFIRSLTDGELSIFAVRQGRWSLEAAKEEAARRKVPLGDVLTEVIRTERTRGSVYVRLKN